MVLSPDTEVRRTTRSRRAAPRRDADFYPTPPETVAGLRPFIKGLGLTLDPAAGDGVFEQQLGNHATEWHNLDIREDAEAAYCQTADFLKLAPWPKRYDTIITNPPFSLMVDFIERGLAWQPKRLIYLARLSILEGLGRYERLWSRGQPCTPRQIVVLPQRPSFDGSGKVDSWAYAWFLWGDVPGSGIAWAAPVKG